MEEVAYLADTMPTTSPYWLNRGPPEFPGLMEVSVWIMLKGVPSTLMARFTQETMPPDMEKVSSPRGLPMVQTLSPTLTPAEEPITTGLSMASPGSTFSTAMS